MAVAPLAVEVGLIVPHDALPHAIFHATPALLLSFITIAMRPVLVLMLSDETGGLRKDTEIEGGVGPELVPLLQPNTHRAIAEAMRSLVA